MGSYNENVRDTVSGVLGGLQTEEKNAEANQTAACFALYYSQGANIVAEDKLYQVRAKYKQAREIGVQGVENENLANNLLVTASGLNGDAAAGVTNAAAAASNFQIAATTITQLATEIGKAYTLVSVEDCGTEIYKMTDMAKQFIQETATLAESMSYTAMEASTLSSKIMANQLFTETEAVKAGIDSLLTVTDAEFNKLGERQAADSARVDDTLSEEQRNEGALAIANEEYSAIRSAYDMSKQELNFDLKVEVENSESIRIFFEKYSQPFTDNSLNLSNKQSEIKIPPADPKYYAVIVPADEASLFNIELAEAKFAQNRDELFLPCMDEDRVKDADLQSGVSYKAKYDINGGVVEAGKSYTVFLYVALSNEYKAFINDFHDLLSVASDPFVLVLTLPVPTNRPEITWVPVDGQSPGIEYNLIQFEIENITYPDVGPDEIEHRLLFLPAAPLQSNAFKLAETNGGEGAPAHDKLRFIFSTAIAEQISKGNYLEAKWEPGLEPVAPASKGNSRKGKSELSPTPLIPVFTYSARPGKALTDIFGAPIKQYEPYLVMILSEAKSDELAKKAWTSLGYWDEPEVEVIFTKDFRIESNSITLIPPVEADKQNGESSDE